MMTGFINIDITGLGTEGAGTGTNPLGNNYCSTDSDCGGFGGRNCGGSSFAKCGADSLCHCCLPFCPGGTNCVCISCPSGGCSGGTYCLSGFCVFNTGGYTNQ
ncbi:Uncharacterised protein [Candidatus Tiddalikarchaeum anstoanum]|nr:Uncharacterised protein [Candidatus Tiddalikarchaeum anstoanum]